MDVTSKSALLLRSSSFTPSFSLFPQKVQVQILRLEMTRCFELGGQNGSAHALEVYSSLYSIAQPKLVKTDVEEMLELNLLFGTNLLQRTNLLLLTQ